MKRIMYYASVALLSFTVAACSEEEAKDTSGPVVTLGEPEKGEEFTAGSAGGVHMEFDLADESGIGQYSIDIHSAADGHSHSSVVHTSANTGVAWGYQKVYDDATGLKNHHVHVHSDSIPANALLGDYHLAVRATDIHGNETYVATTFVLVDHEVDDDHDHDEDE
ncbi:MAG: DUF4625 domain-containing protein [Prevotellaceae bacterium]|jgi:hypothetical protein|nr:DUF4625 domain-containing protein [Prevotellaceae bacterium]